MLAIRCRSCTPVSAAELTGWLEARLAALREEEPRLLARLSRLTQELSDATIDDGWLIEVDLPEERVEDLPAALAGPLAEILRDMRILGLAPTVLAPARLPLARAPVAGDGVAAVDAGPEWLAARG